MIKNCQHKQIVKLERKRYLVCLTCGQLWNTFMSPDWTKQMLPKHPSVQKLWERKK